MVWGYSKKKGQAYQKSTINPFSTMEEKRKEAGVTQKSRPRFTPQRLLKFATKKRDEANKIKNAQYIAELKTQPQKLQNKKDRMLDEKERLLSIQQNELKLERMKPEEIKKQYEDYVKKITKTRITRTWNPDWVNEEGEKTGRWENIVNDMIKDEYDRITRGALSNEKKGLYGKGQTEIDVFREMQEKYPYLKDSDILEKMAEKVLESGISDYEEKENPETKNIERKFTGDKSYFKLLSDKMERLRPLFSEKKTGGKIDPISGKRIGGTGYEPNLYDFALKMTRGWGESERGVVIDDDKAQKEAMKFTRSLSRIPEIQSLVAGLSPEQIEYYMTMKNPKELKKKIEELSKLQRAKEKDLIKYQKELMKNIRQLQIRMANNENDPRLQKIYNEKLRAVDDYELLIRERIQEGKISDPNIISVISQTDELGAGSAGQMASQMAEQKTPSKVAETAQQRFYRTGLWF